MHCMGLVATFQAFCSGKASFYATRLLLGVFEAGYTPGYQYILAPFYKRQKVATRTAIFYVGNCFAAGAGALMAAGILEMHGKGGLAGWQLFRSSDGPLYRNRFLAIIGL